MAYEVFNESGISSAERCSYPDAADAADAAVQPSPEGGRPRLDDCAAFHGTLFVPMTGIPWEELPQELRFGRGMTCRHRLRQ